MPFLVCPRCPSSRNIRDWVPPLNDLRPFLTICMKCCKAFAEEERQKQFADSLKQTTMQNLRQTAERLLGGNREDFL